MSCTQCSSKVAITWMIFFCVATLLLTAFYVFTNPSLALRRNRFPKAAAIGFQESTLNEVLSRASADLSQGVSRDLVAYETVEALLALSNGTTLLEQPAVHRALVERLGLPFEDVSRLHTIIGGSRSSPHDRSYAWLLSPPACEIDTVAVVVVPSLPLAVQRRELIRRGWTGRLSEHGLRLMFVLGRTPRSAERDVEGEHAQHGDLLAVDFEESYYNLSLKMLQAMVWVDRNCSSASYMVKADDDVYVYPDNLHQLLRNRLRSRERKIVGNIGRGFSPHRSLTSKWYVPAEVYSGTRYPFFAFGPCYMVAVDLLRDLFESCKRLPYLYLEDVFITGVCASAVRGVQHEQVPNFLVNSCTIGGAVAVHRSGEPYRSC